MEIIGQKVLHKTFGIGTITNYYGLPQNANKYITVDFDSKAVKLPYPSSFENHLTALDEDFSDFIKSEIMKTTMLRPIIETASTPQCAKQSVSTVTQTTALPNILKLVAGRGYGTNSRTIYVSCCHSFGWDIQQKHSFGKQGALLYAKGATKEGYSPWFVTHSNLTQTKGGDWSNTIIGDYIYEKWDDPDERIWNDRTYRLVFIHNGKQYVFYGLCKVAEVKIDNDHKYIKIYERVQHLYPVD
jgi:hypothetical protein